MKNRVLYALAFAACLTSCSEYEESAPVAAVADAVSFGAEITRTKSAWSSDDEILVTASNSESATYKYDGSLFTSTSPISFGITDEELTFNAVYPDDAVSAEDLALGSFSFTAAADQSSLESYDAADLLVATVTSDSRTPSLVFSHAMSLVAIEIDGSAGAPVLTMCNTATCGVDGSAAATGEAVAITPYTYSTDTYYVVVAPQTLTAGTKIATVTANGAYAEWTPSSEITFEAGTTYSYTWSVVDNSVTFNGADIVAWDFDTESTTIYNWSEQLPDPSVVSVTSGDKRALVEFSTGKDDERVDEVIINIGESSQTYSLSDCATEDGITYTYMVEGQITEGGDYDFSVELVSSSYGLTSEASEVFAASIYDLDAINAEGKYGAKRTVYKTIVDSDGTYIYWTADEFSASATTNAEVTVKYGDSKELSITSSTFHSQVSGLTTDDVITIVSTYDNDEVDELPSDAIDPLVVETPYTISTTSLGDRVPSSSYSAFTWTDYTLAGDCTESPYSSLTYAWDDVDNHAYKFYSSSNTSNCFHTNNTSSSNTGYCVTFDLGAEYELSCFVFWVRRWSQMYGHVNLKTFNVWGASSEASEEVVSTDGEGNVTTAIKIKDEYQQVVDTTGLADWNSMSWIKLVEEEAQTKPDTTNEQYQESYAGYYYTITESSPIRYIRIEFLAAWNGGTNYGFSEIDFWGTKVVD